MRDRELLLLEIQIIAACDKETQITWFNSLELDEREFVLAMLGNTLKCVGEIIARFKPIIEQAIEAFRQFYDGFSSIVQEQLLALGGDNETHV